MEYCLTTERELSFFDFLEDVGVMRSIERRVAAQQNEHDYSYAPHIALLIVIALQHFRSYIVRCSISLVHIFFFGKHLGGSKVNDFDVIVLLRVKQ
jgi:hypothetical protein